MIIFCAKKNEKMWRVAVHKLKHSNRKQDWWIPNEIFMIGYGACSLMTRGIGCNQNVCTCAAGVVFTLCESNFLCIVLVCELPLWSSFGSSQVEVPGTSSLSLLVLNEASYLHLNVGVRLRSLCFPLANTILRSLSTTTNHPNLHNLHSSDRIINRIMLATLWKKKKRKSL